METAKRNRLIKKVLKKEFKKVKVRGGKGTAYGWVDINIILPKPNFNIKTDEGRYTEQYMRLIDKTRSKVWEILKENDLIKELGTYYDDVSESHKEVLININFEEETK